MQLWSHRKNIKDADTAEPDQSHDRPPVIAPSEEGNDHDEKGYAYKGEECGEWLLFVLGIKDHIVHLTQEVGKGEPGCKGSIVLFKEIF